MKILKYASILFLAYKLLASDVNDETIANKRKDLLTFFESEENEKGIEALRKMNDHEVANVHEIFFVYGGPENPKIPIEKLNLYLLIIKKYTLF
ncbi:hypothetical protein EZY14_009155 [Kordia sp. TARA_039_SRF]|nr:hypothetical protein EZY14_009155 [Kordia sp. TARA_039_SRF]